MANVKRKVNKKEMEKNKSLLMLAGIMIAFFGVIAISYAWLTQTVTSDNDNVIIAGNLQLSLGNEDPILRLGGAYGYGVPISDDDGIQTTPYTFTITNTGTVNAKYSLYLDDAASYTNSSNNVINIANGDRISDTKIDYNLRVGSSDTNEAIAKLSTLGNPRQLVAQDTLTPGQSKTYYLRIWIDKDADTTDTYNKVFAAKLRIEATQTENPTIPNTYGS